MRPSRSLLHLGLVPVALATVALSLAACGSSPPVGQGTTTTAAGNTGVGNTGVGNTGTTTTSGGNTGATNAAGTNASVSPLSLSPVTAVFVQAEFATHYTVQAVDLSGKPTYSWRLQLKLVDKASAADPDMVGSAATVDPGCDNHGVGITAGNTSHTDEFIWHHPDAKDSTPPGYYHCNHLLMGPHGHQGVITVIVAEGAWVCTAHYGGTNSGTGDPASCRKS